MMMPIPFDAISIRTVPPAEMRYQTVGDWQVRGHVLQVNVAASGDRRTDMVVALHEAIEAVVYLAGKPDAVAAEEAVDAFDEPWQSDRYEEAGDDPAAPYHDAHVLATCVERLLIRDLGMTWEEHTDHIDAADEAVQRARGPRRE